MATISADFSMAALIQNESYSYTGICARVYGLVKTEYDSMMPPRRRIMEPEAKRARIVSAGERLFAKKGYTATSMAEVADAAGVAVGTVYRIFPDKAALLASLHLAMEDSFIVAMERGWNEAVDYPDRFAPMVAAILEQADKVKAIMPLYTLTRDIIGASEIVPGARMIAAIDRLYAQGLAANAFHAFPDGVQAPIAHGVVEGAMRALMQDPSAARRDIIAAEAAKILRRAFVVDT